LLTFPHSHADGDSNGISYSRAHREANSQPICSSHSSTNAKPDGLSKRFTHRSTYRDAYCVTNGGSHCRAHNVAFSYPDRHAKW
jgi:hypothetical protein